MRVSATLTVVALAAVAALTAAGSAAADDYEGPRGTITQTADSHPDMSQWSQENPVLGSIFGEADASWGSAPQAD